MNSNVFLVLLTLLSVSISSLHADSASKDSIAPLSIGDVIPDELWNLKIQVVNHPEEKDFITLNDFRDKKLIILDFWATWCAPCIKSLRSLDTLSTRFPDDLFILPSTIEVDSLAEEKFKKEGLNLFSAVSQVPLRRYFPAEFLPHQVWIKDGQVFAISDHYSSTYKNISDVLTGKTVMLKEKKDLFFDPYTTVDTYAKQTNTPIIFNSILTGFIDGVGNSGRRTNDSIQTFYFLNRPILDIYRTAFRINYNQILVKRSDSTLLANKSSNRKHLYCYQLFAPSTSDSRTVREKMIMDLNLGFGLIGKFEKRKSAVYVIKNAKKGGLEVRVDGFPVAKLIEMLNYAVEWSPGLNRFVNHLERPVYIAEKPTQDQYERWRQRPSELAVFLEENGIEVSREKLELEYLVLK